MKNNYKNNYKNNINALDFLTRLLYIYIILDKIKRDNSR